MIDSKAALIELGREIRAHRENRPGFSQNDLAAELSSDIDRQTITHLENGTRRLPSRAVVEEICDYLNVPRQRWEPFFEEKFLKRYEFEAQLSELVGVSLSAIKLDESAIDVLEDAISKLIPSTLSVDNSFDALNTVLIFYGVRPLSRHFFEYYLQEGLTEFNALETAIRSFQKDAIRLFSTFSEAYKRLNSSTPDEFSQLLKPLEDRDTKPYSDRVEWNKIDIIPNQDLPYLGYIAAAKLREKEKKGRELSDFLREIAAAKRTESLNMEKYSSAKKRRMDSYLREFDSKLEHTLSSPLFLSSLDAEVLEKEADRVSPKEEDFARIERTQSRAYSNLCNYLSADYLDVYVATSMRGDADFVSVNDFVETLFKDPHVNFLKLRYFNPTQSWIGDRVAKGLVEALMLRRADICIYMAQKGDTFGKDSEASVTLGQGKAVIVYVPKLFDAEANIDTEKLGKTQRTTLVDEIRKLEKGDVDDDEDNEALMGRLLKLKLAACSDVDLIRIVRRHWADFDLEGEFVERTKDRPELLNGLRAWLEAVLKKDDASIPLLQSELRDIVSQSLVGRAIRFEARATVFREIHPLALQIILSNRVLNGILVARSPEACAKLIKQIVQNRLETQLENEIDNYKLIEKETGSIIRVISKHTLIANSFETFYRY